MSSLAENLHGLLLGLQLEDVPPPPAPPDAEASELVPVEALTTPALVGQMYLVPCLKAGLLDDVPVLGPRHSDPDISGGEPHHYHLDLRFVQEGQLRALLTFGRELTLRALFQPLTWLLRSALYVIVDGEATGLQPRLCLRQPPIHPGGVVPPALEASLGPGARLTPEGRCPHRGFPVAAMPLVPDEDGRLVRVCPGHGLRFTEDGALLPRGPQGQPCRVEETA